MQTPMAFSPCPKLYQSPAERVWSLVPFFPMEAAKGVEACGSHEIPCHVPVPINLQPGLLRRDETGRNGDSLPPDVRKVIDEINVEWAKKQGRGLG